MFHLMINHKCSVEDIPNSHCKFKLKLQSGNAQFESKWRLFFSVWPWNLTDDIKKQKGTSFMLWNIFECFVCCWQVCAMWDLNVGHVWIPRQADQVIFHDFFFLLIFAGVLTMASSWIITHWCGPVMTTCLSLIGQNSFWVNFGAGPAAGYLNANSARISQTFEKISLRKTFENPELDLSHKISFPPEGMV